LRKAENEENKSYSFLLNINSKGTCKSLKSMYTEAVTKISYLEYAYANASLSQYEKD
jgi:hypothetical protein